MKRMVFGMRSILAGIAVAGALYALLWQQVGGPRGTMYLDPTSRLVHLFLSDLMPGLFAIAVVGGLVCGAVGGEGRLRSAPFRAWLAGVLFGAIVLVVFTLPGTRAEDFTRGPHGQMSLIAVIPLCVLTLVLFLLFSAFGSAPYAAAAAAAASAADSWRREDRPLLAAAIALSCSAATALSLIQGASARSDAELVARLASRVAPLVDRHLVELPPGCRWRPLEPHTLPQVSSMRCAVRGGSVNVQLSERGVLKAADAVLTAPEGTKLRSRRAAESFLRSHGVREQLLLSLKRNKWGAWEAGSGGYSVILSEYQPPFD